MRHSVSVHPDYNRRPGAKDQEIWDIYPVSMIDEHFDPAFDEMMQLVSGQGWVTFAVLQDDRVVGMSSYINPDAASFPVQVYPAKTPSLIGRATMEHF